MKQQTIDIIKKEKLIVIVRGVEKEKLIPLAESMYQGGIRLLEITYSKDGLSDEETAQNIAMLAEHFNGRMVIGAGTVLNTKQVELTKNAGGRFIISPNTNKEVIEFTNDIGLVSLPGAMTPSEIEVAYEYGADFVKLFPVTSLGAEYVKAVKAPLAHIPLLAVGGIDLNNIKSYLNAGISGIGLGSNIVNKELLAKNKFDEITRLAEQYCIAIKEG